ncbi:MAG: SMI1/KNR4 family protein [Ruminococcus sp.]|uniref:hypothetical protein n=1 Tax=Ruminococcus sp. TaxID=41978 RepID=UPI001B08D107|nr:hypothetical protein [Ruminococcus sp.]MBO7472864.1 SMI1/KNR4 family protein [Ruminococcus sp.]
MVVKTAINHKCCCFHFRISNYRLFSTEHDKLFNPQATIKQIKDFEQEIGMPLPVPFGRYLTELGNGGVGADYGIWSLDEMRRHNKSCAIRNIYEPMLDHSLKDSQWRNFAEEYVFIVERRDCVSDDECKQLTQQLIKMQNQMAAGGIYISTPGCTMLSILMCRGNASGEVLVIDFNCMDQTYSEPYCNCKFEDWIINDLQKRISKIG